MDDMDYGDGGEGMVQVVGRAHPHHAARHGLAQGQHHLPAWRQRMAQGVPMPGYGLVNMPLRPDANDGVFDPTNTLITFTGKPQKPFKGERLLTTIGKSSGATGSIVKSTGVFVGTDIQQASLGRFSLENYTKDAFGVRFSMVGQDPGVETTMDVLCTPNVPASETVAVAVEILGRYAH
jgi:hypothetical protein